LFVAASINLKLILDSPALPPGILKALLLPAA
jgi:hypothetical protein